MTSLTIMSLVPSSPPSATARHCPAMPQYDLVRVEQARDLNRHLFPPARWTLNAVVSATSCAMASETPPSNWIRSAIASTSSTCSFVVLVEQQMQLIEGRPGNLPVVISCRDPASVMVSASNWLSCSVISRRTSSSSSSGRPAAHAAPHVPRDEVRRSDAGVVQGGARAPSGGLPGSSGPSQGPTESGPGMGTGRR